MKNSYKTLLISLLLVIAIACNPDDEPSAQELAFEKLAGSWNLQNGGSIELDGQDISLNYAGFTLSFTDGEYTTINAGDLFRASGTWTWTDQTAGEIDLDDGKEVTIVQLTETLFQFSFSFNGTGGTANGLAGNYTITVNK